VTSTSRRRRTGFVLTLCLPLTGVAFAAPAGASTTSNEAVFTVGNSPGTSSVVVRDLGAGRNTTVLPARPGTTYQEPELSPDGSKVTVGRYTDGASSTASSIVVLDRATGVVTALVTDTTTDTSTTSTLEGSPAFSPDSRSVVYGKVVYTSSSTGAPTSTVELDATRADGSTAPAKVTGSDGASSGSYDPTGSKLVIARYPAGSVGTTQGRLAVLDTAAGTSRDLGPTGDNPKWSPDGAKIVYSTLTSADTTSNGADVYQLATVPAAGGTQSVLVGTRPSTARSDAEYPSWSPDSESILFDLSSYDTAGNLGTTSVWAVDAAGSRAGQVAGSANSDSAQPFFQGPRATDAVSGTASRYVPVTPTRLLDTRPATLGPDGRQSLQIRGARTKEGAIPAGATAVVLNVALVGATATTNLRAYASGSPMPVASNLNAAPGQTVASQVTTKLGNDGAVVLRNAVGQVGLVVDISGYYVPASGIAGNGFAPLAPSRVLDTRNGTGGATGKVRAGSYRDLKVTGSVPVQGGGTTSVPATASAVVLNVTALNAPGVTNIRVYPTPTDGSVPTVSSINVAPGEVAPNLVTVKVGQGGRVRLYTATSDVDLLADIAGYYDVAAPGRFIPVDPLRFLDTRDGTGTAPIAIPGAAYVDLRVTGTRAIPAGATAAVLSLTGTGPSTVTNVRAYPAPADGSVPTVSNLNLAAGQTRADAAIVKPAANGRVRLRNSAGTVQLIADVSGYFLPAG